MDIDLLSKIVKELILDNDEVTLPGVGSFVAELVPSAFSDKGYTINPPYKRLSFRQKEADNGKLLISFYAKCNNLDMETASKIMREFLKEMRHILEVKKTILFPGLGKLRATRENCFFFVADEDLDIYPEGFGLEPISLKTHEETPAEVSVTMAALRSILGGEDEAEEKVGKVNADGTDAAAGGKTSEVTEKAAKAGESANAEGSQTFVAATVKSLATEAAGINAGSGTGVEVTGIPAAKQGEVGKGSGTATGSIGGSGIAATAEANNRAEASEDAGLANRPVNAAGTEAEGKTQKESQTGQAEGTAEAATKEEEGTASGSKSFTDTTAASLAAKAAAEKVGEPTADGKTSEVTAKAEESATAETNREANENTVAAHSQNEASVNAGQTNSLAVDAETEASEKTLNETSVEQTATSASYRNEEEETAEVAVKAEESVNAEATASRGNVKEARAGEKTAEPSTDIETSEAATKEAEGTAATESLTEEATGSCAEAAASRENEVEKTAAKPKEMPAGTAEAVDIEKVKPSTEKIAGTVADGKIAEVSEKATESASAEATASRENKVEKTAAKPKEMPAGTAEAVDIEKFEPSTEKIAGMVADDVKAEVSESARESTSAEATASRENEVEKAAEKTKKTGWKILKWTVITLLILAVTALAAFMILAHTAPDFIDSILYTPEELEILNM